MSAIPKEKVYVEAEIIDDDFKAPVLQDIKYPVSEEYLESLSQKYKVIPEIDLDAPDEVVAEQFAFVLEGHKTLVKVRNKIEKTRKAIKEPAYTFGKNVDDYAKKLKSMIADEEASLKLQRDRVEQNEARKQAEAEALEEQRVETIKTKLSNMERMPLELMSKASSELREVLRLFEPPTEVEYEEFYEKALVLHSQVQSQLTQMANDKELVENAQKIQDEKEAEAKRLKEIEDKKLQDEKEEFAREKAEFQKEKDDLEAKKRAVQEEADREEAIRIADELQSKQEEDEKAKVQQNRERHDAMVIETMKVFNSYKEKVSLLDAIISGEVPHVQWVS